MQRLERFQNLLSFCRLAPARAGFTPQNNLKYFQISENREVLDTI